MADNSNLGDPGFAKTNPGYVDRDPGFSKKGPGGPDIDPGFTKRPGPLATPRQPSKGPKPFIGPTAPPSAGFNPRTGPTPTDRANNPNRVANVIGKVGDYLGNVMRSARDIPTAFGTAMDSKGAMSTNTNERNANGKLVRNPMSPIKNIGEQIGQYAGSLAGKTDNSRSSQYYTFPSGKKSYIDSKSDEGYFLNNPAKLNPTPVKPGRPRQADGS